MDRLLFDSDFLRRLECLSLTSRRLFRGEPGGEHRSAKKGCGLDFADYRAYQAGDDFRSIDWNLYYRLDRLFVRQYVEDEDLTIHLLLDTSRSMAYGRPAKLDYARRLAAALGYIGIASLDRVGATAFAGGLAAELPPRRGRTQIAPLLEFLGGIAADGTTCFSRSLADYALRNRRPGLAIVLSDLLDEEGYEKGLLALRYQRFDLVLLQVLDPDEIEPLEGGSFQLEDMETRRTLRFTAERSLLDAYRQRTGRFLGGVEAFCLKNGIEYIRTSTLVPFEDVVLRYLRQGAHLRPR